MLLKSPTALERLAEVDTVVFDKTGTLTEPTLALADDGARSGGAARGRRRWRRASRHPLARSLAGRGRVRSPAAEGVRGASGAGAVRWRPARASCGWAAAPSAGDARGDGGRDGPGTVAAAARPAAGALRASHETPARRRRRHRRAPARAWACDVQLALRRPRRAGRAGSPRRSASPTGGPACTPVEKVAADRGAARGRAAAC